MTAAKDHGVSEKTIDGWLGKGAQGSPSWSDFNRIQKQNKELFEVIVNSLSGFPRPKKRTEKRKKRVGHGSCHGGVAGIAQLTLPKQPAKYWAVKVP